MTDVSILGFPALVDEAAGALEVRVVEAPAAMM